MSSERSQYYIASDNGKEGPLDLVTLMRRIRSRKVGMDTLIFIDTAIAPLPAGEIEELRIFFGSPHDNTHGNFVGTPNITLSSALQAGKYFAIERNIMMAFAGSMALLCLLCSLALVEIAGPIAGGMAGWSLFVILHFVYAVFCLRLYREQPISSNYINEHVAPALPTLILSALCLAFMMAGGFLLFLFPALLVAVYYAFVPFFIIDRKMRMVEAMVASRLLVQKHHYRYASLIACLILAYIGSLVLIIPAALTIPIFTVALVKIYEDLSSH